MYNYFIWDKKSKINNCNAEEILKTKPFCDMNKIVFFTQNNKPFIHADVDDLRVELNIDEYKTDEFVCETYINILIENDKKTEEEPKDELLEKIAILEANQKAILAGDMQTLAYNLYPEDFIN